jgi:hypothetical protein
MLRITTISVALLMTTSVTAAAPTATDAFACNLPYKASMEALAAVKVKEQKAGRSLLTFTPMTMISFEPGATRLFGVVPSALSVELTEPKASDPKSKLRAVFLASLPKSPTLDTAITKSTVWHNGWCNNLNLCIRAESEEAAKRLGDFEFRRETSALTLTCRFELAMSELEN